MPHTWQPNRPAHFYSGYSLVTDSLATQSGILQNTATNTNFYNIFLHTWPIMLHSSINFFIFSGLLDYNRYIQTRSKTNTKGSSMRHKRGEISKNCRTTEGNHKSSNYASTVSMESPFEILERHDDHAHSDGTSRERLVLPKQTQNWGPPLKSALGTSWRT